MSAEQMAVISVRPTARIFASLGLATLAGVPMIVRLFPSDLTSANSAALIIVLSHALPILVGLRLSAKAKARAAKARAAKARAESDGLSRR